MLSRRAFLRSALLTSVGVTAGLAAQDLGAHGYAGSAVLEELTIPIEGLPESFRDYRIGFITDIHLGIWVLEEWLEDALETLQRKDVDILILGGDYVFVNNSPLWTATGVIRNERFASLSKRQTIDEAFHGVGRIVSRYNFPDGSFGVVGNHERWNSIAFFFEAMKSYPLIRFLINEEAFVRRGTDSLSVLGVDDFLTGLPIAPPPKRPSTPRILVS